MLGFALVLVCFIGYYGEIVFLVYVEVVGNRVVCVC